MNAYVNPSLYRMPSNASVDKRSLIALTGSQDSWVLFIENLFAAPDDSEGHVEEKSK